MNTSKYFAIIIKGYSMKLSVMSRYAVRFLLLLAQGGKGLPQSLASLSERVGVAMHPAEQALQKLREHGLVTSVKGPLGGYCLAKKPDQITLGDVVRIMEDGVCISVCCGEKANDCPKQDDCENNRCWHIVSQGIERELDKTTIAMIVQAQV